MLNLITSLFMADDLVELRLIETWVEAAKKRSRFVTSVCDFAGAFDEAALRVVNAYCEITRANVFFGVCPRPSREPGRSRTITRCR